jgi:hypothetical protein
MGLCLIPGTAAGVAQDGHDGAKVLQGIVFFLGICDHFGSSQRRENKSPTASVPQTALRYKRKVLKQVKKRLCLGIFSLADSTNCSGTALSATLPAV